MKITICGSMAFHEEMKEIAEQLCYLGHEVELPILRIDLNPDAGDEKISIRRLIEEHGGVDAFPQDHWIWKEKANAINDHFTKVAWSDAILVVNYPKHGIDGYVGGNTLMELAVARYLNKKIFVLHPVSSSLSYKEEILGIQAMVIHGNLSFIS